MKTAADSRQLGLPWLSPVTFCPTHLLGAERKVTTKQIRRGLRTYRSRRTQSLLAAVSSSDDNGSVDRRRLLLFRSRRPRPVSGATLPIRALLSPRDGARSRDFEPSVVCWVKAKKTGAAISPLPMHQLLFQSYTWPPSSLALYLFSERC